MAAPATYSFLDVNVSIVGPNGSAIIGNESGVAEEGITAEFVEDKVTTRVGADGFPLHMLHAGKQGRITIRMMKNSPVNAILSGMYNLDTSNASTNGLNTIVATWKAMGDVISGQRCAFAKNPTITYSKDGAIMNEWVFNVGILDVALGAGLIAA